MTEAQFIQWLQGFVEGVHHYNITPKQWDYLKEKIKTVNISQQSNIFAIATIPLDFWVQNIS